MILYLNNLLFFINYWLPWFNFILESFILQYFILYVIVLLYCSNNIYYVLLYSIFIAFWLGIFLAFYGVELFTAFLWLVELSVFFVFLLLLFFLNIKGFFSFNGMYIYTYIYLYVILFYFLCVIYTTSDVSLNDFSFSMIYEDYYQAFSNSITNDFFGIYISYYYINFLVFLVVGLILLVGSVFCITLFNVNSKVGVSKYFQFFKIFNFFDDFVSFFFLRKQNLTKQGAVRESVRVFKKK